MDNKLSYKKYEATEPYDLLNIDTFYVCNEAMCKVDSELHFINASPDDAAYFEKSYKKQLSYLEFEDEDKINAIKQRFQNSLTSMGYDLNKLVEPVIFEK